MSKSANTKPANRGRRSRQYRLPLSASRDLQIAIRSFKTKRTNRSKACRQLVIQLLGLPIKEICFSLPRRRKQPTTFLGFRIGTAALIILGLCGGLYSTQHLQKNLNLQPVASKTSVVTTSKPVQARTLARSQPTSLQIDSVSITAPIVNVGLRSDQTIEVPAPDQVGWYDQGPTPGEKGPAVLVGHVDQVGNIAVFWRLRYITPGDVVKINRADGSVASFRVDSIQQFDQNNFPTQAVYGAINYAGIRLITCGGTFDSTTHHYSQNTVVFGTLIN